jgi:hypothetical protein
MVRAGRRSIHRSTSCLALLTKLTCALAPAVEMLTGLLVCCDIGTTFNVAFHKTEVVRQPVASCLLYELVD